MCGIVGFIGAEEAAPILLDGLERLEYRGYDSAGLAVYSEADGLKVVKAKGRLQVLSDIVEGGKSVHGTVGLGHTRWATHGEPSDINSHPHVGMSGRIAVVHNGIIENYAQIKEFLESKGVRFVSQTDTEVVAQLLEYYYRGDLMEAVTKVLHRIEGAYALGILCADCPDRLIAARKDSPLILGYGDGFSFLASDVTAIIKYTREVCYLEDGEIAVLTRDGIQVYDHPYLQPVEKEHHHVDWEVSAAEKGGYEHFMAKEIMEQPKAFRDTVFPRIQNGRVVLDDLNLDAGYLRETDKIYIIACGSSYHVGMVAKYILEKLLRKPVEVTLASEFRYCDPLVTDRTLCLVISQSGETIDTLAALREAKRLGARILSIVNVVGSSIARESDDVLYTWAGPEIAVATTKAYSTQLAAVYLLATEFGRVRGTLDEEQYSHLVEELEALPGKIEKTLADKERIQWFASKYAAAKDAFFIGRGLDYAVSLEGSLKFKEISYIHSEAFAAGEMKHGPISLVEKGTLVVGVLTQPDLYEKTISNMVEAKSRGAFLMGLTTYGNYNIEDTAGFTVYVPRTDPHFATSLSVIPLQLLAYYVSCAKGLDVDKPRNLAKSVTVE